MKINNNNKYTKQSYTYKPWQKTRPIVTEPQLTA